MSFSYKITSFLLFPIAACLEVLIIMRGFKVENTHEMSSEIGRDLWDNIGITFFRQSSRKAPNESSIVLG